MPYSPSWLEVISDLVDKELDELNTIMPGRVRSYDRTEQTASVEPLVLLPNGSEMPVVVNVPVIFPGAYWDLDAGESGETGLLLIGQWDWRRWYRTGDKGLPETTGRHDLANAAFVPGLRPKTNTRTNQAGSMVLSWDDLRLGDHAATEPVLRGDDLDSALSSWADAVTTWASAVSSAITLLGGDVSGPTSTLISQSAVFKSSVDASKSTIVKVE